MKDIEVLRQEVIQKMSHLPGSSLQEVLHFVDFLVIHEREGEDPILRVAGCLSGSPLSAEEVEEELYGKDPAQ